MMKHCLTLVVRMLVAAGLATPLMANDPLPDSVTNCLRCHDGPDDSSALILQTPHAVLADSRNRFAEDGCASCHGPSVAHAQLPASIGGSAPDIVFDGEQAASVHKQNQVCSACHTEPDLMYWSGGHHESAELSCSDCHVSHQPVDPMRVERLQNESCLECHRSQQIELHRPFSHPVGEGQLACTDCHNPHGGPGPADLHTFTANDSCFGCHAEKRGPFLWEHQPVREDCGLCHEPHGSVHRDLLTQRTPFLCQQCHMAQFHPSTSLSGTGLPGESLPSGSQSLLGRDCMNCHVQVHGSNHPSGVGQTR